MQLLLKKIFALLNKQPIVVLLIFWGSMNSLIYSHTGIKLVSDSMGFIEEAESWIVGQNILAYRFWYSGYVCFLFILKLLHLPYQSIVFIQLFFSFFSIIKVFRFLKSDQTNAWFCSLFLIFYFPIQQWNFYIMTDSLFTSFIIISLVEIGKYIHNPTRKYIFIIPFVTTLIRPNGFTILLSTVIVSLFEFLKRRKVNPKLIYSGVAITIVLFGILILLGSDIFLKFAKVSFESGEMICGYHSIDIKKFSDQTLFELWSHHPLELIKLFFGRIFFLVSDIRPFYSLSHNLFCLIFLAFFYINRTRRILTFKTFCHLDLIIIGFIILNVLLVGLTYSDWDGRFLCPILGALTLIKK
jgi:hypothetical protein